MPEPNVLDCIGHTYSVKDLLNIYKNKANRQQKMILNLNEKLEIEKQKIFLFLMNEPDDEYDDKLNISIERCKQLITLLLYATEQHHLFLYPTE